ncbi:uncharacterized protein BYT42DRAFT_577432 [Radiomyces spectabilis]|uniref:uncharacterized protein n=1 Tax=Radiomyces spectabilis TaxID=64574 RepID=UPI002220AEAC|nr:uncharacterized protein BYT42DRAFT_577432 [Radiomyces spectabilis]KAI8374730.1 hypothetical protein BYT42DRAFT_577432 [Radiomyces spectabilis]
MAKYLFLICLTLLSISTLSSARWAGQYPPTCFPEDCASDEDKVCEANSREDAYQHCDDPQCPQTFGHFPCLTGVRTCCVPSLG